MRRRRSAHPRLLLVLSDATFPHQLPFAVESNRVVHFFSRQWPRHTEKMAAGVVDRVYPRGPQNPDTEPASLAFEAHGRMSASMSLVFRFSSNDIARPCTAQGIIASR